jgi:branched-chain amino acid transport system substrate-binding protein
MGWQPSYQSEAHIYAKYILKEKPGGKIGVLYQNDDFGKDYLKGLKDGLGPQASMIVAQESYETSEPSIDDHVVRLRAAGVDVFVSITTPKFAAQAIKKLGEVDWHPLHILTSVSASVGAVMQPAGFENSQGILSAVYLKDGADPQWDGDAGMKKFVAFLGKYYPEGDKLDGSMVYGYAIAQTMVKVLEMCGDDLTRENVMRQAANMKDFKPDTLLPGIAINTSPSDFAPIKQLQMMRFKGEKWDLFGDIISSDLSN